MRRERGESFQAKQQDNGHVRKVTKRQAVDRRTPRHVDDARDRQRNVVVGQRAADAVQLVGAGRFASCDTTETKTQQGPLSVVWQTMWAWYLNGATRHNHRTNQSNRATGNGVEARLCADKIVAIDWCCKRALAEKVANGKHRGKGRGGGRP